MPFPSARRFRYTEYRVTEGDRVDTIANDFYGDARLWWIIANANPEILDWFNMDVPAHEGVPFTGMTPGYVLRIPDTDA